MKRIFWLVALFSFGLALEAAQQNAQPVFEIAPMVRTEITEGLAVITGNFTQDRATQLVKTINNAVRSSDESHLKPRTRDLLDSR